MHRTYRIGLLFVLALVVSQVAAADKDKQTKKKKPFQATCPVQGQPALESSSVDYRGKKVYFCCPGCPAEFEADPKAYAAKAHLQLFETGQIVQVACPLSGHDLNPELNVKIGKVKVGLCCENCEAKLAKASELEKIELVFNKLETGFTLQTTCPVSGKAISPEFSLEHNKKKVYFCCKNCPAAFKKNPDKFTARLPQFAEQKKK